MGIVGIAGITGTPAGCLPVHAASACSILSILSPANDQLLTSYNGMDAPSLIPAIFGSDIDREPSNPPQKMWPAATGSAAPVLSDLPLPGLLRETALPVDYCGLHQGMAAALILAVLGGWISLQTYSTNRKLRHEMQERKSAEAKFRSLVEQRLVGIFIIQDCQFVYINPKFAQMFGYPVEDMMDRLGPLDLIAQADQMQAHEYLCHPPSSDNSGIHHTFSAIRRDGSLFELGISGEAHDYQGRPAILGVALDITEQNRMQRQLNYLAFYDSLTELPNRALFFDRLNQTLAYHKRSGSSFALMVLDLDGFKGVNDAYGHQVGDLLLVAVGRQLRNCIREADTVARMGGDEFTIILQDIHQSDNVILVANKILATLTEPLFLMGYTCRISASLGICIAPRDGSDMETLLSCADAAMYESKARGKNTYTFYRSALNSDRLAKTPLLEWSEQLHLGVTVIDEQHSQMVALLNRIGEAIKQGREEESVMVLFNELAAFSHMHFETERQLMDETVYTDIVAHQQEHRKLLEELHSIRGQFDSVSPLLTLQTLKDWLRSHIIHSDRALAEALIASGTETATQELFQTLHQPIEE